MRNLVSYFDIITLKSPTDISVVTVGHLFGLMIISVELVW